MIAFILLFHILRLSALLLHTSIILHFPYPPKPQLYANYMNHTCIPWQGLFKGYQFHGSQFLILLFLRLHGHHVAGSLQLPGQTLL